MQFKSFFLMFNLGLGIIVIIIIYEKIYKILIIFEFINTNHCDIILYLHSTT